MHRCLSGLELRSNRRRRSTMEGQGHMKMLADFYSHVPAFRTPYSLCNIVKFQFLFLFFLFKQIMSCLVLPGNTSTANWLCLIHSLISASQASRINGKHPLRKSAALLTVSLFHTLQFQWSTSLNKGLKDDSPQPNANPRAG